MALLAKSSDGSTWAREHIPDLHMVVNAEGPDDIRNADLFVQDGIFELWERGTAPAEYYATTPPPPLSHRLRARLAAWLRNLVDRIEP